MKNFQLLLLSFALLLSLSACNKDNILNDSFSCKVDGVKYEASGLWSYATDFSSYTNVYGVKDNGNETIYFAFPKGASAGTYTFNADYPAYYTNAAGDTYTTIWGTGSGSVTIESINSNNVKGTFKFTAYDVNDTKKIEVTEGKFDVNFQ